MKKEIKKGTYIHNSQGTVYHWDQESDTYLLLSPVRNGVSKNKKPKNILD